MDRHPPAWASLGVASLHSHLNRSTPSTSTSFSATSPVEKSKKVGNGTASRNLSSWTHGGLSCSVFVLYERRTVEYRD